MPFSSPMTSLEAVYLAQLIISGVAFIAMAAMFIWSTFTQCRKTVLFATSSLTFFVLLVFTVSQINGQSSEWTRFVMLAVVSVGNTLLISLCLDVVPPVFAINTLISVGTFVLYAFAVSSEKLSVQIGYITLGAIAALLCCICAAKGTRRNCAGSIVALFVWTTFQVVAIVLLVSGKPISDDPMSSFSLELAWSISTGLWLIIIAVISILQYEESDSTDTVLQWLEFVLITNQFAPERAKQH